MSSTDASHSTALIRAFHSNELMPLAHELRRRGKTVFPSGPDGSAPTYYISRAKPAMDKADFEVVRPGLRGGLRKSPGGAVDAAGLSGVGATGRRARRHRRIGLFCRRAG